MINILPNKFAETGMWIMQHAKNLPFRINTKNNIKSL